MRNFRSLVIGYALGQCIALAFALYLTSDPILGWRSVYAQQANLTAPVTPSTPHHYRAESAYGSRDGGGRWEIVVSVRDIGDAEIAPRLDFTGPDAAHPGATALAYVTAQITAVGGETGGNARRMDARYLTFLQAQGYISATVVP